VLGQSRAPQHAVLPQAHARTRAAHERPERSRYAARVLGAAGPGRLLRRLVSQRCRNDAVAARACQLQPPQAVPAAACSCAQVRPNMSRLSRTDHLKGLPQGHKGRQSPAELHFTAAQAGKGASLLVCTIYKQRLGPSQTAHLCRTARQAHACPRPALRNSSEALVTDSSTRRACLPGEQLPAPNGVAAPGHHAHAALGACVLQSRQCVLESRRVQPQPEPPVGRRAPATRSLAAAARRARAVRSRLRALPRVQPALAQARQRAARQLARAPLAAPPSRRTPQAVQRQRQARGQTARAPDTARPGGARPAGAA